MEKKERNFEITKTSGNKNVERHPLSSVYYYKIYMC